MHGVERSGLAASVIGSMGDISSYPSSGKIAGLSAISLVLSNLVSNVPAVMLLRPLTQSLGDGPFFWLALAMSSTLAGNFTLIGSVANLIVAQQARKTVEIGFMEYFRVGAVITVLTIVIGILILAFEVRIAHGETVRGSEFGVRSDVGEVGVQKMGNTVGETSSRSVESLSRVAERPAGSGQRWMRIAKVENRGPKFRSITVIPESVSEGHRMFRVVLVCDTPESRARGLQGFRPLKQNEAALFVFQRAEVVTFWMGTVTFPIDIVFVDTNGIVTKVFPNCRPGSRDFYASERPAGWVIETAAGAGIRPGDRIKIE